MHKTDSPVRAHFRNLDYGRHISGGSFPDCRRLFYLIDGYNQMELRKSRRVVFERGYDAQMMAIDGTWRRACKVEDISDTGAKLSVESSIQGLPLKEFFLVLSSTGLAFRRCELSWVNGDNLGVYFKKAGDKKRA